MKSHLLLRLRGRGVRIFVTLLCLDGLMRSTPLWTQTSAIPAADRQGNSESVRITAGDTLEVRVYQIPEFSGPVRVSGDGRIHLAYLGDVQVAGMTESEAAHRIDAELLSHNLVLNPQTTVYIPTFSARGVTILGEVVHPGVYPLPSSRSLVDIVAEAGGLTPQADTRVSIRRSDGSINDALVSLPTDDGKLTLEHDIPVGIGDRIVVQRAGLIYVLGEVTKPGGYVMQVDGKITVLQALAAAGGPTRTAGEKRAVLIQRNAEGTTTASLPLNDILRGRKPDFSMRAGDVIYVPTSNTKNFIVNAPGILGTLGGAAIYSVGVK